jgi:hypothetical protein
MLNKVLKKKFICISACCFSLYHCTSNKEDKAQLLRSQLCSTYIEKADTNLSKENCVNILQTCSFNDLSQLSEGTTCSDNTCENNNDASKLPSIVDLNPIQTNITDENPDEISIDDNGNITLNGEHQGSINIPKNNSTEDPITTTDGDIQVSNVIASHTPGTYDFLENTPLLTEDPNFTFQESCSQALQSLQEDSTNTVLPSIPTTLPLYLHFETVSTTSQVTGWFSLCCGNAGDRWGYLISLKDLILSGYTVIDKTDRTCYPKGSSTKSPHFSGTPLECGIVSLNTTNNPLELITAKNTSRLESFPANNRTFKDGIDLEKTVQNVKISIQKIQAALFKIYYPSTYYERITSFILQMSGVPQILKNSIPKGIWINMSDNNINVSDRCQNMVFEFTNNVGSYIWRDCPDSP